MMPFGKTTIEKLPYTIVLLHGGPGAAGSMTPLAELLAPDLPCFAPWQTALSIPGQIKELKQQITSTAAPPVILIGHSWGAWLGWLFTAAYPQLVKKLIMIAPGVFEEKYVTNLMPTRLARLSPTDRDLFDQCMRQLHDPDFSEKDTVMAEFGKLMRKADTFDALEEIPHQRKISFEIYHHVWPQAAALRKSGQLLTCGNQISCPVVVFLGAYDSTPPQGVIEPLSGLLSDFRWYILKDCGHYPWAECLARETFIQKLKDELL